jgi:hypothetical protein
MLLSTDLLTSSRMEGPEVYATHSPVPGTPTGGREISAAPLPEQQHLQPTAGPQQPVELGSRGGTVEDIYAATLMPRGAAAEQTPPHTPDSSSSSSSNKQQWQQQQSRIQDMDQDWPFGI